jgi:hypothetical protein
MPKKYFIQPYVGDEFNQLIGGPVTCDLNRKHFDKDGEYYTFSTNQFVALNNAFDKIFIHKDANIVKNHFQIVGNSSEEEFKHITSEVMSMNKISELIEKYCSINSIDTNSVKIGELFKRDKNNIGLDWHPYDYNYSHLSRNMQEGSFTPLVTTKKLYDKYDNGDLKTIVINGRNYKGGRKGQEFRNNLFPTYIQVALDNGFKVINVTDLKPNLSFSSNFDKSNYIEVDNNKITYFEKIAMFQNANAVLSISNGAGITTHLCVKSNFYCYGQTDSYDDRWADNDLRYSWNGKSIVDSRKLLWPDVSTNFYHDRMFYRDLNYVRAHLSEIALLKKPAVDSFFDESKLVYLS